MYAVIERGSKQYKIAEGDCLNIDLTEAAPDAKTIELDKVLFVSDGEKVKIGTPYLKGAKVTASFKTTAQDAVVKGKKLYPMHLRRRKHSRRRIGHRQKYLQVVIDKIKA
ncbi:MAG: 50S ribosomal protein L21 [Planctomycetota bacterium]|jgi:large subunit ribosomal protein L21